MVVVKKCFTMTMAKISKFSWSNDQKFLPMTMAKIQIFHGQNYHSTTQPYGNWQILGRQWPWSFLSHNHGGNLKISVVTGQIDKILTMTISKSKFLVVKMVNLKFGYEIEL